MSEPKNGLARCMDYSHGFSAGAKHEGIPSNSSKDFIDGYVDGKKAKRAAMSVFAAGIGYKLKEISIQGGSQPPGTPDA